MKIIQAIWMALTNENPIMMNIISIPCSFLEITVSMLLFTIILSITYNRKTQLKYIVVTSSISIILSLLLPNPYKSIAVLILLFVSARYFFNLSIIKNFLAVIIPILFNVLCESIITKIFSSIINSDSMQLINIPIYRLIISLIIYGLMFVIYLLIKYFKIHLYTFEITSRKNKIIIIANFIVASLAIAIQFIITGFYMNVLPWYIFIFSNISLIAYFLLSIYSLIRTMQLEITSLDLAQEKEHNKILKLLQDDLHAFRHDFSNILCTISGYVQVKDMDGLAKYYSQIQKDINKVNNLGALNPDIINNPAIFALISSKYNNALQQNIEMNINIYLDLDTLNMKIYEFTRILGILLDNALEASKECNEKIINIEMRKDSNHNRQILIIENTYNNKDVDTEKIFEKKYTTKEGNSGLGLWEIRQILKRNNNLNLFTSKTDKYFKQQLEMY